MPALPVLERGSGKIVAMTERTTLQAFRRAITDLDAVIDEVERIGGWDRPAPCEGWVARDVVAHLAGWTPFLIEAVGRDAPDPDATPVERWRYIAASIDAVLSDPAESATEIVAGPAGAMPFATAVSRLVIGDVVVHTWDLARAIDLPVELDATTLGGMLAGMEAMEDAIRGSGHFGPRVEVPADASVVDRALAFTGRDPAWRAPAAD